VEAMEQLSFMEAMEQIDKAMLTSGYATATHLQ
jgi:hypothetical protein